MGEEEDGLMGDGKGDFVGKQGRFCCLLCEEVLGPSTVVEVGSELIPNNEEKFIGKLAGNNCKNYKW